MDIKNINKESVWFDCYRVMMPNEETEEGMEEGKMNEESDSIN